MTRWTVGRSLAHSLARSAQIVVAIYQARDFARGGGCNRFGDSLLFPVPRRHSSADRFLQHWRCFTVSPFQPNIQLNALTLSGTCSAFVPSDFYATVITLLLLLLLLYVLLRNILRKRDSFVWRTSAHRVRGPTANEARV